VDVKKVAYKVMDCEDGREWWIVNRNHKEFWEHIRQGPPELEWALMVKYPTYPEWEWWQGASSLAKMLIRMLMYENGVKSMGLNVCRYKIPEDQRREIEKGEKF